MRRLLPAAALLAAVAVLTACGGGGDDGAASAPSSEQGTSNDEENVPDQENAADEEDAPGAEDDGIPEETIPRAELTPAEGEFSEEEQDYLTERVPEGADPAAILELGSAACDRLGYLDRHDPEAAVTALREGDIPDAEAAVEHLCPEYADLLTEARGEE
ncbi:hypothetical protein [Streptomyces litchfieldiae]|uniref:DUF732 domain-containing protein n=1 Tax=Streptomyces litchfieldiae TaxID=3075543 RepID=A0ABU2MUQ8_9ACTN|nr:hypothetical protein [Streptomyces sp. DSM 44938]MDT0344573.1 hypothetical protein [Streptomyces sp. DSM 44938]